MDIVTPDLCDSYPDTTDVVDPIFRSFGGRTSFGGQIVTVKCHEDNSLVRTALADVGQGKVLVVDGGGSQRCALLGDRLAAMAADNRWEGVVVFGCIRDVAEVASIHLGVQALAAHPRKTEKKGIGELNVPVTFGGVRFQPGAFLYADSNGIVVAPRALSLPRDS
ncbi:ribonuclease E activity regulator RraA [Sulfidibacter corallicola]|uniref:4-hydroxy-4-methyl-2-oxoglutarate aldolase n=1 Tax=Sulfidibacter corallicola TaxID=2818388 RepID=A0A8A4TXI0_SULCO|nr:ribonuclease E activity regulator RraA [Sulfidibacter corallicola]QTD53921.1 ribonuclease E activity regulator RraA [Sulfidibacter corallicola]